MITLLIPHTTVTVVWFLLINVTFVSTDAVRAATRFELVIDEPYEYRNAAWPVTTDVPFPRGRLTSVEHCRLVDDRGLEQPVQARIAATWDRQRTSIHWLTINLVARPGHQYALEFGPDVDRQQFDSMLIVERSEPFRISTGAIRVGFSSRGPSALGEIRTALDGDGKIAAEEVIAAGANGGSQFWATYHRTLETTTLAYYLTGDERYNDVLNYWRDLAGKTSASTDFQPCHREQPWYVATKAGEPAKTWAEMIRDYAPFISGLRTK